MKLSPTAIYNSGMWEVSFLYRWTLIIWRAVGIVSLIVVFFLVKMPVEVVFTRLLGKEHGPFLNERITTVSLLRHTLVEMGSIFVKFGQILAMEVMVPQKIRDDLMAIVDDVPTFNFKEVRRIVEAEFPGKKIEDVFSEFDRVPDHAASLGQLHRAVLRAEGDEVAIKVQRPYIQGVATLDLTILDILIKIGPYIAPSVFGIIDLKPILKAFTETLWDELDFQLEGRNQERWATKAAETEYFGNYLKIAKVYWPYSTTKVLTMEYVRDFVKWGTKRSLEMSARSTIPGTPYQGHAVMMLNALFNAIQLLDWGFFHGDMHRGNWYLWDDPADGKTKLFVCDFGMRGDIPTNAAGILMRVVGGSMIGLSTDDMAEVFYEIHEGGGGKREDLSPEFSKKIAKVFTMKISGEILPETGLRSMRLAPQGMKGTVSMDLVGSLMGGGMGKTGFKIPEWMFLFGKLTTYHSCLLQEIVPGFDGGTAVYTPMILKAVKKDVIKEMRHANSVDFNRQLEDVMHKKLPGDLYGMWEAYQLSRQYMI